MAAQREQVLHAQVQMAAQREQEMQAQLNYATQRALLQATNEQAAGAGVAAVEGAGGQAK